MKVLLVAPIRFYNAEAEYIRRLALGLLAKGHRAVVLGRPNTPLQDRAAHEGIPVCDRFNLDSLSPARLLGMTRNLSRYLAQERFDVVNVHRSEGFIFLAQAVRRLEKRPALIRTRGDMRPVRRDPLNRRLYGRFTDRVIATNELLRQELIIRLGLDPGRVHTVRFGLNPNELAPRRPAEEMRRELRLPASARVVGMLGRIGPVKGHRYLLEAAPAIVQAVPEAVFLVLYSMIEEKSDFQAQLRASPLRDRFHLVGPRPDLADLMQLAEVAVIPSVGSEANCRVALEWMSLGKPVIGSRVGVIPELIEPATTGFLLLPRVAPALADAVISLLRDPARARRLGQAGRRRVEENFTDTHMIQQTEAIFTQSRPIS
jgi:glycosyltransferase involved in cell wall biosynthesis